MGEHRIRSEASVARLRELTLELLDDIDALGRMIESDALETDVRRIGAEQEMFLVDDSWRPAPIAMEMLERLPGSRFTTELARYNLEINLDPLVLEGPCLSTMLADVDKHVAMARAAAHELDSHVVLAGILPTLRKGDLGLENLTPRPRYSALNEAMNIARGGPWRLHIKGLEELASKHDSVMLESCCTSFQAHLQVTPAEFPQLYNTAQAVTAPVLAAAANSPLLFGRRLWHETRIPVFQQAIDTRRTGDHLRQASTRVRFGENWVDESILELFREDAVRFRMLLSQNLEESSFKVLEAGGVPKLGALCLHNGTIYRWNRGCYGVSEGKPHLRIEMRALPAGPSTIDEIANAAFFFGLVLGLPMEVADVRRVLRFSQARANFQAAAKYGLDAQFVWFGRDRVPARELILERLAPTARRGLEEHGVDPDDVDWFIGVIEERVRRGQNGATWLLGSYARLGGHATQQQITTALTAATVQNQEQGAPVHEWGWPQLHGASLMNISKLRVEDIMSTDVHAVGPDEPVELAGKMMEWKGVRHIPVEDLDAKLVGLLSCFHVIRHLGHRGPHEDRGPHEKNATVGDIMDRNPPTITPTTPIGVALTLMREQKTDCLPVVQSQGRLVGIVTERDFIQVVGRAIERSTIPEEVG